LNNYKSFGIGIKIAFLFNMQGSKELYERMEKDPLIDFLDENHPSPSPASEGKTESPEPKDRILPNERTAFLLFPFFIDLINQFRETLKNLRNRTRIYQEKFSDKGMGAYLSQIIVEDIKKIDLMQKSLLNYVRINNPIIKTDTVNNLIEEELKKSQVELEEKKIKFFKTLEKNLPETVVPDDQLRYILSSVLQYVMALMPSRENFGLLTRSLVHRKEKGEDRASLQKGEKYVEILMVFTGYQKATDQSGPTLGIPARQKEGILNLTLRLVDEVVQRNRGIMTFEEDEENQKTTVSLRFPVERRKVVYYQSAKESSSSLRQSKTTFEKLSSLEEMTRRD
jgi:hypothetical protein